MSALDKALRQIEQQRQIREDADARPGRLSEFHFPVESSPPSKSRWMPVALAVMGVALLGSWLIMAGWWSAPLQPMPSWLYTWQSAPRLSNDPGAPPSLQPPAQAPAAPLVPAAPAEAALAGSEPRPVTAVAPVTQTVPVSVPERLTTSNAISTAPALSQAPEPDKLTSAEASPKFIYPRWHKAADRMWNWGLWDEASRLWLKGLKTEDPKTPMVLIADHQSLVQATKQYAAWSPLLPVVVLPKSVGKKKLWLLLAVPAGADLPRARQLLMIARGQAPMEDSWSQWQASLGNLEVAVTDSPSVKSSTSQAPVAPVPAAPVARTAVASTGTASGDKTASRARTVSDDRLQTSPDEPSARAMPESPQLSRTEGQRLPVSGPVPPTAKAIDVDYQLIEKSLARGDHQAALDAAIKLEKYIGENWRTQYLAGVAYMGLNRWEQSVTALGKALELNPRHATAALYLSVALQERGEHARAIQVLDKAQQLQPLSPELWLNQGHSHQALGHKAEARKAYNRFLELSVNRQDLAVQRVWVQNRLQKDNG